MHFEMASQDSESVRRKSENIPVQYTHISKEVSIYDLDVTVAAIIFILALL